MQHNESNNQPGGFRKMLKEKGYYILLTLCIVAVGVSGAVFVSSALRQSQEAQETLSIPAKATDPDQDTKTPQQTPASTQTSPATPQGGTQSGTQGGTQSQPQTGSSTAIAESVTVAPVSGTVIGDYAMEALAYNATTQDWRVHNGVDLAAAEGETVMAARDGTVTAVYEDEAYGTTVVIQHDDGYTTHYCNLAEGPAVSAGQTVAAGDAIGVVGRTAVLELGEDSHLHFAVFLDGAPVDPNEFLT